MHILDFQFTKLIHFEYQQQYSASILSYNFSQYNSLLPMLHLYQYNI